jgi:hypothetical protein
MLVGERKCHEVTEKGIVGEGQDKGKINYLTSFRLNLYFPSARYLLPFPHRLAAPKSFHLAM